MEGAYGTLRKALAETGGLIRLLPAWVARDWLPPGRRLGLAPDEYDVGERGFICERWLASTTHADNRVGPADEGLSYVNWNGPRVTLAEVVDGCLEEVVGEAYAQSHDGLGRLAKIFDFSERIPYHIHPRTEHASLVGAKSKDEAYYFPPGVDMGAHPETFLGVHPYLADTRQRERLLPYLVAWKDASILENAPAYLQLPEHGFFVPSGVLHAPGTALTIELQEDSDTLAMFQALNAGRIISKDLLFKDVPHDYRCKYGERFLLEWVDWAANGDPDFYERHHFVPVPVAGSEQGGGEEYWLFQGTTKFSGKKLIVRAGERYSSMDAGAYSLLVWQGVGSVGDEPVRGGVPGRDEMLVTHRRATAPLEYRNVGSEDLVIIKFFGPDINMDAPMLPNAGVTSPEAGGPALSTAESQ